MKRRKIIALVTGMFICLNVSSSAFALDSEFDDVVNDVEATTNTETTDAAAKKTITFGDYTYYLNDKNNAVIKSYSGKNTTVSVESSLQGYTVVGIEKGAFTKATSTTTVIIPKTITQLSNAFTGSKIVNIQFEEGITAIPSYSFKGLKNINEIVIPKSVKTIGKFAFSAVSRVNNIKFGSDSNTVNPLNKLTIPNTITCIDRRAFEYSGVSEVTLPGTVNILNLATFFGSNLKTISIGEGTKTIGSFCFAKCANLEKVNIPKSVVTIGTSVFFDDYKLFDVFTPDMFPNTINNIGDYSFLTTNKDKQPKYDTKDGYLIKNNDPDLEVGESKGAEIVKYSNTSKKEISIIRNIDGNISPEVSDNYKYYSGMKVTCKNQYNYIYKIGDNVFNGNSLLNKITIDENKEHPITEIGNNAFSNCSELTTLELKDPIDSMGDNMASNCNKLVNVDLGKKIKVIGKEAFSNCSSLEKITIPDTVAQIGSKAFYGTNIKTVTLPQSTIINIDSFNSDTVITSNGYSYIISSGKAKLIKALDNAVDSTKKVTIPNEINGIPVTEIDSNCFCRMDNIENVEVPSNIDIIDKSAFSSCSNLAKIKFSKNTTIFKESFEASNVDKLVFEYGEYNYRIYNDGIMLTKYSGVAKSIDMEGQDSLNGLSIVAIGKGTYSDDSITSLKLPKTINYIEAEAFPNKLTNGIKMYQNNDGIYSYYDFGSFVMITGYEYLPNSGDDNARITIKVPSKIYEDKENYSISKRVLTIAPNAFYNKKRIKDLIISNGITSICKEAFAGCDNLVNVSIPPSVKDATEAFSNQQLNRLTDDDSKLQYSYLNNEKTEVAIVTYIGENNVVIIPETIGGAKVVEIKEKAFEGCDFITSITIPNTVTNIGENAFLGTSIKEQYYKNLRYNILSNNKIEIKAYIGKESILNIPKMIGGNEIIKVDATGINSNSYLKEIKFEASKDNITIENGTIDPRIKVTYGTENSNPNPPTTGEKSRSIFGVVSIISLLGISISKRKK